MFKIGHGYDVHRLVYGRRLILGGVTIPFEKGLYGHSDADVAVHAVMDSIIGALGLGDIGKHFPDTSQLYKDADSLKLASYTKQLLDDKGFSVGNIDVTIIAQLPKLSDFIDAMRSNIAAVYDISPSLVNVKATTEEGLGFTGVGDAIAAHAVALIYEI